MTDLFIGSTINVYSRQLNIVDYADSFTRRLFEAQRGRAFAVVKPAGYNQIGEFLKCAQDAGFVVGQMKMVQMSGRDAEEFCTGTDGSCQPGDFTGDVCLAVEMVDNSPGDASKSAANVADALNGKYRDDLVYASPASSAKEDAKFAFGGRFAPRAVYDNCSLCVIRPHAVRDGLAGGIVDAILLAGFEVSAMQMFNLDRASATEFFDVYKDVFNDYSSLLEQMTSGPCIAIQVRGEGVVERFREYCGPVDVEVAQTLYPDSLRAKFGVDRIRNAVHCTDLPDDGVLESQYFFNILQM